MGEKRYNTELTNDMAKAIYLDPRGPKDVSGDYPASPTVVSQIQKGTSWRHATKGLKMPVRKIRLLDDAQARQIFLSTEPNGVLAKTYNVDTSIVRMIKKRQIYKDCTDDIKINPRK